MLLHIMLCTVNVLKRTAPLIRTINQVDVETYTWRFVFKVLKFYY